jgi:hypothetical protein
MVRIKDDEYLARKLLDGVDYKIGNDSVYITSPHTSYAYEIRLAVLDEGDLLNRYKNILNLAKKQEVKISYKRSIRKTINERWAEYEADCKAANEIFDCIVSQAKTVQDRGLHSGTTDDVELDKLHQYRNAYSEFFWRNKIISIINGIDRSLQEMERDLLSTEYQVTMITL